MSVQIKEQINKKGLITYLDGAYSTSIVNGSLVWKDITRQTADTTLTNGAYFSNLEYIGGVKFDGVDDYITIPYRYLTTESFAVELWFYRVPPVNYLQGILSCGNNFDGTTAWPPGWSINYSTGGGSIINFGMTDNNATHYWIYSSNIMSIAPYYKPCHVFAHRNTDLQALIMYVNGVKVLNRSFANTITLGNNNRPYIDGRTYWGGTPVMDGTYYMVKIYHNYNFSDEEMIQTFTSTRERFSI